MGISRLVFLGLVVSFGLKAQNFDSMEVKAFDLGLPEPFVEEVGFTLADKYGKDSTDWPIWARSRITLTMFGEDSVNLSQFTFNDHFFFSFDPARPFSTRVSNSQVSIPKAIIQEGVTFEESNGKVLFNYLDLTEGRVGDVDVLLSGDIIDVNKLENVKKTFPNSYDLRDGRSNILGGYYHPDSTIHLSTISFKELEFNTILQLYYYKGELIYMCLR